MAGRGAGLACGLADGRDIDIHLVRRRGKLLNVVGDFLGGGTLFFDCRGNGRCDFVNGTDRVADRPDRGCRFAGCALDGGNLRTDIVSGLCGLIGQRFYLGGDDGKPLGGLTRTRRLDRGIQRQQDCLTGDVVDQFDNLADLRCCLFQPLYFVIGHFGFGYGRAGDLGAFRDLARDFLD